MQQIQCDKMTQEINHPNHYVLKLDKQGLISLLVELVLLVRTKPVFCVEDSEFSVLRTLGASSMMANLRTVGLM